MISLKDLNSALKTLTDFKLLPVVHFIPCIIHAAFYVAFVVSTFDFKCILIDSWLDVATWSIKIGISSIYGDRLLQEDDLVSICFSTLSINRITTSPFSFVIWRSVWCILDSLQVGHIASSWVLPQFWIRVDTSHPDIGIRMRKISSTCCLEVLHCRLTVDFWVHKDICSFTADVSGKPTF